MRIEIEKLEEIFQNTADGRKLECPLPEPGHGAPNIEEAELLNIKKQPAEFNYDKKDNDSEAERFKKTVLEALEAGEITQEEADKILN